MKISIDHNPKPAFVWWACSDGWHRFEGYIIEINKLMCSVVLQPEPLPILIVSELNTGLRIADIEISLIELIMYENRKLVQSLIEELVDNLGEDSIRKINSSAAQYKWKYEKRFGEMPEIEFKFDQ